MSPEASEKSSASGTPQRPIRIADDLWDDFGLVAGALKSDRSALIRDYVRWITYDDSVKAPKRPAVKPDGLRYIAPLPPEIGTVSEGEIKATKPRTRYILRIEGETDPVLEALVLANEDRGAMYHDSSPMQISTNDRAHALRMLKVLTERGFTVLKG